MTSDKQMTLMLQIKAQANGLIRGFGEANNAVAKFSGGLGVIQSTGAATFSVLGKGASLFFMPLKIAAGAVAGLTTALVGLGGAAIHAAAGDEELIARLAAVYGSAEKARKVFAQLEALSAKGPFKSDDMAEAVLVLRQFGLASEKNLGALANASRVAGGSISDMANSVAMLQVRGLKKFGIGLEDQADGSFVISYRNQAGKIKTMAAKDGEEVRRKLLGVLGGKFGTDFKPKSFNDFISMIKTQLDQVMSNIGAPMLRSAQRFLEFLGGKLTDLLASGKLEQWGEKLAGWLEKGANYLMAAFDTIPSIITAFQTAMKDGPAALKTIITSILSALGKTLVVAFVEAVSATASIWVGIGKMLAGLMMEQILQLPMMGGAREKMAYSKMESMSPEEATQLGIPQNLIGKIPSVGMKDDKERFYDSLTPQQQVAISASGSEKTMVQGFEQARSAIPGALDRVGATASEEFGRASSVIKDVTGTDIGGDFSRNLKAQEQQGLADRYKGAELVTARVFKGFQARDPNNSMIRDAVYEDETHAARSGQFRPGQKVRGGSGTVINIQSLNVTPGNLETFKDDLIRAGFTPPVAAAAT